MRGALSILCLWRGEVGLVILGIDPGLAHTGWGLSRSGVARSAVVPTVVSRPVPEVRSRCACRISPMTLRMSSSVIDPTRLLSRVSTLAPTFVPAIPTAHARGAALVALSECALEIGEYTPMQIKQAVVGTGAADKRQVALHGTHANTARPRPASRPCRRCPGLRHLPRKPQPHPRPHRWRVLSTERNRILMISQLHGTLVESTMGSAVVDVSGVGFELGISGSTATTLPTPGGEVRLYTRMQVREDAMTLFGFSSKDERTMFDRLVSVSGVGPRLALAVLSTYTVGQLYSLVMAEDDKGMAKVPGVGKKTAQRLILELKSTFAKDKGFVPVDVIPGQVSMPVPAAAPSGD